MTIRNALEAKIVGILTAQEIHDIIIGAVCGIDTIDEGLTC